MKKLLVGITGSFCNHQKVLDVLTQIKENYEISFVFTNNVSQLDTRFHLANDFKKECERLTMNPIITNIVEAEKIGPKNDYDIMAIIPCSANSLSRLVHGAYDCAVSLCAKAMIRNQKNVVVGIASNDILGISGVNLMRLMNMKHFYLLPFFQDEPILKPNSCTSCFELLDETLQLASINQQIQPILREKL